jgi:uncharacterized membrane protein HdeD (DUF308 family)
MPMAPAPAVQFVPVLTARRLFLVLAVMVTLAGAVASIVVVEHSTAPVESHGPVVAGGQAPSPAKLCLATQRCVPAAPSMASGPVSLSGALAFVLVGFMLLADAFRRRRAGQESLPAESFPSGIFRPPIAGLA